MRRRNWRLLPRGLGWRLTAVTLGLTTVCLLLFGGAGTMLLYRSLTQEVDARLHTLLAGPFPEKPPPDAEARSAPFPTDLRTLIVDADGEVVDVVGRTNSDTAIPDVSTMSVGQLRERAGRPFTVPGIYGESRWRVVTSPQDDGTVQVAAQSLEDVDGTLRQLTLIEIGVGLVVLILLGFAAVATVRLQLRPLHEIEATAQGIAEGDLDRRIPDQDPATEAGRLGAALNAMLSGLSRAILERDRSVAVTRRFVADASHELRTPLSSIRGFAELYRQGRAQGVVAEDPRADRWMSRIEKEAGRMAGLVEDLLQLARFDEAPTLDRTDIELGEIAEQVAAGVRVRTPETRIDVEAPAPVHAVGDAERIRQVLENLVGNAVTHTSPGTPVSISVRRSAAAPPAGAASIGALPAGTADAAVVVVRDQGPGIPEERVAHLFERFYRVDESRSRGGAGLGLSISASFVIAHDGFITVDSVPGRGTAFTFAIPAGG